jgi:hypothetical protein
MSVIKIISGGQTGADQGALYAAKDLALATGGQMPKGWKTEAGPRPDFAERFGLEENSHEGYRPRTTHNVLQADGTLIFGRLTEPGSMWTQSVTQRANSPLYTRSWSKSESFSRSGEKDPFFLLWLERHNIRILNVAGNRESRNPGIFAAVRNYLIANLT